MQAKVVKERRYKAGYIVRDELVDGVEFGCEDFVVKSAYTFDGAYIGDSKTAYYLCKIRGIAPEPRQPVDPTANGEEGPCSIGFCELEQKWYGWSHRGAIYGFGIGHQVERGDCGYTSSSVDELFDSVTIPDENGWAWQDTGHVEKLTDSIRIRHDTVRYMDEDPKTGELLNPVPSAPEYQIINIGRGEWIAETLEDAKQMACDFAESIS